MPSIINATTTNGVAISPDNSGSLQLQTNNGTTAVTIDTSQNVGIGTSSPNQTGFASPVLSITNGTSGIVELIGTQASDGTLGQVAWYNTSATARIAQILGLRSGANNSGAITFQTASAGSLAERMRIDSSGNLLVGTTSNPDGIRLAVKSTVESHDFYRATATGGSASVGYWMSDVNGTKTAVAYIRTNGGLSNYSANDTNLSDERIKTDIKLAGSYLDKICAIPVRTFKYKNVENAEDNLGVIAQEVEAVAPELISNDGFGETPIDGVPLKSIYQTDLQYALMKCIQELKAELDSVKAELNTLKNPPVEGTE